jgi:tetratricopeptide (TPR) repeat protein
MLLVAADRFMPRPELPSFLLLAGILALLDRHERRGDAWVFAIVPLQLLWANVHGLFALGVVVCAMALAAEILRPLVAPGERLRRRALTRLAAVAALSALACLANPNFLDGALYPIQQLGMVGPPEERGLFGWTIAELTPTLGSDRPTHPFGLALVGSLAALSFAAMALNWRRLSALDPLLWVAFGWLALGAQRNLALFAIVAAPIGVRNLNAFLDRHPLPRRAAPLASAVVAAGLLLAAWDVATARFFERQGLYREAGLGVLDFYYPIGAAEWIAEERPPGPICHHMADGGYLIWRLHPDYLAMLDGRLELFGEERFAELQVYGPDRFRALHERYRFGTVLVHHSLVPSEPLLWWLDLNPAWRLVFVDDVAALFVRAEDPGATPWPELYLDTPGHFPPLEARSSPGDRIRRKARTGFYMALRRWEPAIALWEETLERYPDLPQGPLVHATLLARTGHPAAAEAVLRRLLAEKGSDPHLLAQIGDLRLPDDPAAAGEFYDEALRLAPGFAYAAFRRGWVAELEQDPTGAALHYQRALALAHPADPVAVQAAERLRLLAGGGIPPF